jgi:glucokinase
MRKLGIDLGGTNVRMASLTKHGLKDFISSPIEKNRGRDGVINQILSLINEFDKNNIDGIGIGVPSYVDTQTGIVYDTVNLPGWDEVNIKNIIESKFKIPVSINNDANCFAVGEKYYGKGKPFKSIVGITLGTGVGAGIIINGELYEGKNCGAGEIGALPYLDKDYEFYTSSNYFTQYSTTALETFEKAKQGDLKALNVYKEYGHHLGELIKVVLLTYNPEAIILGGSIAKAYLYFHKSMSESINKINFKQYLKNLNVEVSSLEHAGIYGAAHLAIGKN